MSKKLHVAAGFWTSQHVWNTYFSLINNLSGIRPNPYAYDTAKHILLLSMGILPGMAPSDNNDAAPIQAIQNIFQNDYKLDKYLPIVMQLKTFNPYSPSKPIYYSLNYPNATELSPRSTDYASTILELYEVKSLINLYLRKIQSNELNISNTVMSDIPKLVNFDFFHSDPKAYRDIRSSNDLFQEDPQFLQTLIDSPDTGEQEHPTISSFVRGCVRISYKNQES